MLGVLEILVSTIFFANKTFLLAGKKTGWVLGALAAALATYYFLLLDLYVYTALEICLVVLMLYGFFKRATSDSLLIRIFVSTVLFVLSAFCWNGLMTLAEFVSSVLMIFGTYFLSHSKERFGWMLYGMAHVLAAYLGFEKEQLLFAHLQIASAIVSFTGASKSTATSL